MTTTGNAYCDRLDIEVPGLEKILRTTNLKLFHLMIVALLEHGGPMSLDRFVTRFLEAGLDAHPDDLAVSLEKAWHGLPPVLRNRNGDFELDFSSIKLESFLFDNGLRRPRVNPHPVPEPTLPEKSDEEPLTAEELDAACRGRSLWGLSPVRQAAAVLDVTGHPMTLEQVEAILSGKTRHRSRLRDRTPHDWRGHLVTIDDAGKLTLALDPAGIGAMRRAIRKLARPVLLQQAREAAWIPLREEAEVRRRERHAREHREAQSYRRAVLHALPSPDEPRVLALLDMSARTIRTFLDSDRQALVAALAGYTLLAGLHIGDILESLDLDLTRWHLVDLKPPRKTKQLNRSGRKLQITPELLISATTGISRPLADPAKIAAYLDQGDTGKLLRRLESDAKALFAFYQYGILHNSIRLRWGFLDEYLSVDWALPGDTHIHEILDHARKTGTPVELVLRTAPGWTDPWSRAQRFTVHSIDVWAVTVSDGSQQFSFDRHEIQAARLVGSSANFQG